MLFLDKYVNFLNWIGVKLLKYSIRLGKSKNSLYQPIKPKEFDILPKGTHVFGAANKYLLIPKNRYRVVLLPEQEMTKDFGIGWITENNTPESYNQLWGNEQNLKEFREENDGIRDILTREIVDVIENKVKANMDIVDIGCGAGDLLAEIISRVPGVNIHGLDFSSKAIEAAKRKFLNGAFKQFVIEKQLPYEDSLFDIVMCTDVLEHLEYPRVVINELLRICKSGGYIFIVVPDGDVDQFLGHYWFWNQESLEQLFQEHEVEIFRLPVSKEFIITMSGN